jgi:hypothetical protein
METLRYPKFSGSWQLKQNERAAITYSMLFFCLTEDEKKSIRVLTIEEVVRVKMVLGKEDCLVSKARTPISSITTTI